MPAVSSQSVIRYGVFKRKSLMDGKINISLKKDKSCFIVLGRDLTKIIVKFKAEKRFCLFVSCTNQNNLFERCKRINMCTKRQFYSKNTLKRNKLKVYISLKGDKLALFVN